MSETSSHAFLQHQNHRGWFWLTLTLAVFMAFWKLGDHHINAWDEARQGINALQMMETGNYIDYHYADEIDQWNSKPQLMAWSIVGGFTLLGTNAWGLRLPAAIGCILLFWFTFRLIEQYRSRWFAFVTSVLLMSCHAVFAIHIGRTGDYEALLLPALMGYAWNFLRYHDFGENAGIWWAGFFLGMAFWAKGTPSIFLLPGTFLYVLLQGTLLRLLKDWRVYAALGVYALFIGGWVFLMLEYSADYGTSKYGANRVETMFLYDTIERYSDANFQGAASKPWFFFTQLDAKLNLWNYLFYLAIGFGLIRWFQKRKEGMGYVRIRENRLIVFAACCVLTVAVMVGVSSVKLSWYLAPIFPFIAMLIVQFLTELSRLKAWTVYLFIPFFLFTFGRHIYYLSTPQRPVENWLEAQTTLLGQAKTVLIQNTDDQALYLNLKLRKRNTHYQQEGHQITAEQLPVLLVFPKQHGENNCGDDHCMELITDLSQLP